MELLCIIFYIFLIILLYTFTYVYRRYRKLTKRDKQTLENQLRRMGFFIVLSMTLIGCSTSEEVPLVESIINENPILLPSNTLNQASETIDNTISSILDIGISADEDTWRSNINDFLNDSWVPLNNTTIFVVIIN